MSRIIQSRGDSENRKGRFSSALRTVKYKTQPFKKYIPLVGIIILFAIYWSSRTVDAAVPDTPTKEKLIQLWQDFWGMFIFNNALYLFTTIILIITLWYGYKYWLLNIRFINRNSALLERIVIASIILIFIFRHVKANSAIGGVVDWVIFLILLYLVIAGSWYLAKTIDTIDLHSDLYCWGLRLLGLMLAGFGILLFMSSALALTFSQSSLVMNNIWWIISICLILLGAFMEYRSFRRHAAIMVW